MENKSLKVYCEEPLILVILNLGFNSFNKSFNLLFLVLVVFVEDQGYHLISKSSIL